MNLASELVLPAEAQPSHTHVDQAVLKQTDVSRTVVALP